MTRIQCVSSNDGRRCKLGRRVAAITREAIPRRSTSSTVGPSWRVAAKSAQVSQRRRFVQGSWYSCDCRERCVHGREQAVSGGLWRGSRVDYPPVETALMAFWRILAPSLPVGAESNRLLRRPRQPSRNVAGAPRKLSEPRDGCLFRNERELRGPEKRESRPASHGGRRVRGSSLALLLVIALLPAVTRIWPTSIRCTLEWFTEAACCTRESRGRRSTGGGPTLELLAPRWSARTWVGRSGAAEPTIIVSVPVAPPEKI